jgi:outer membrane receptor protein involved in Fe transport
MGPWAVGITSELFRTDGYIAVPADLRGAVDAPVNSQDATGDWDAFRLGAFELHAYASRQNLDQSFSAIDSDRNGEHLTRTQRVPAQRVGFSVQWRHTLGTRQQLVAGLEESNIHGQTNALGFSGGLPTNASEAGGREATWGGYVEDIVRVTPNWLLTLSGRVDRWQNFDAFAPSQPSQPVGAVPLSDRSESFFSPRLALLHKLTNNLSLTASGYRSFRAPTLNELYRSFRAGNVFTEANTNLGAERLTGAEGVPSSLGGISA